MSVIIALVELYTESVAAAYVVRNSKVKSAVIIRT